MPSLLRAVLEATFGVDDLPADLGQAAFSVPSRSIRPNASSFFDVKCGPGFMCVSKVNDFGVGHDGVYHAPPILVKGMPRRLRGSYEVGCPARGTLTGSGACRDDGHKGKNLCWSTNRFEGGEREPCNSEDKCLCIRSNTANGLMSQKDKSSEVKNGVEVKYGNYMVQDPPKCDDCRQHDLHEKDCRECDNCEYGQRTVAGEAYTGCWHKDNNERAARAEAKKGRPFLHGMEPHFRDMAVIPHYPMWDPGEKQDPPNDDTLDEAEAAAQQELAEEVAMNEGARMPYQLRAEVLSRKGWIDKYQEAAPRVQLVMDELHEKLVGEWQHDLGKYKCWERHSGDGGTDVVAKAEKALAAQRACQQMQDIARTIAPKTSFPGKVHDVKLRCIKDSAEAAASKAKVVAEAEPCAQLNCYVFDPGWKKGIEDLQAAGDKCEVQVQSAAMEMPKFEKETSPPPAVNEEAPPEVSIKAAD
mmetsp:Transcript_6147/g.14273  ORF Transcript_6147/g.14273 Transcript_6147/m.14273 type:complete len:471 (+) Transcript_6147:142-1554(+)|eukprot:CAMPEP_0206426408 /NCGR_PEP_ID=MMETSP0324_2-20121206/4358_1 /ASSEMBLY_ACC=CAM_ASM_000836 /TAXON_ID=2866 /ORGANISM="Crypthecodinium cohnii, Strain Seligo" /LENGTH=470 /DNA_ID=CAMNT_0053891353 /DNA_START=83 /DNA_END=1495 /DNA_ORIENTATION=+